LGPQTGSPLFNYPAIAIGVSKLGSYVTELGGGGGRLMFQAPTLTHLCKSTLGILAFFAGAGIDVRRL